MLRPAVDSDLEFVHRLSMDATINPFIAFCEKLGFAREGTTKNYFSREGREGYFDEHLMAMMLR